MSFQLIKWKKNEFDPNLPKPNNLALGHLLRVGPISDLGFWGLITRDARKIGRDLILDFGFLYNPVLSWNKWIKSLPPTFPYQMFDMFAFTQAIFFLLGFGKYFWKIVHSQTYFFVEAQRTHISKSEKNVGSDFVHIFLKMESNWKYFLRLPPPLQPKLLGQNAKPFWNLSYLYIP